MSFFDHSYYKTSKTVSRLIGRWPYQDPREKRICNTIIIILFTTQIIAQVLGLVVNSHDSEVILELISPFMIDIIMAVKFVNLGINVRTMMELLQRVEQSWTVNANEDVKSFLDKYAYIGQLVVYGYIGAIYVTVVVFIVEPLLPQWTNLISQSNITIPNKYPVTIHWYMIDMEKNYHFILCYEIICIIAILTITVANDSLFIILLQHACGLFAAVGYQFRNISHENNLRAERNCGDNPEKLNSIQYDYYVMCIENHKRAIEFSDRLEDLYVWNFGVVIALNMPIMSVTAVQIVTQADTIQEVIKYSMFAGTQIMHLFFDCYLSQQLTDCSTAIQEHITQSKWYRMSLESQKLLTMVVIRSQLPNRLTAGKLVKLSMETFGVIIKTSISYFTVMVSMR